MSFIPVLRTYSKFLQSRILPNSFWQYLKFRMGLTQTYWPKDKTCAVTHPRRIYVGINSRVGRPGAYLGGAGGIYIGDYVIFGPNVGILSSNHDLYERDKSVGKKIVIGNYSWIGMNALVLAGVELGPSTIVAGGSVVTKSFPEGYCVLAGSPAKVIKYLDREKVEKSYPNYKYEFNGFIPAKSFDKLKKKYLL